MIFLVPSNRFCRFLLSSACPRFRGAIFHPLSKPKILHLSLRDFSPTFFPGKNEVSRSHSFSSFVFGPGAGRPSRVPLPFLPPGRPVQIEEDRLERQGGRVVPGHGEGARKQKRFFLFRLQLGKLFVLVFFYSSLPRPARSVLIERPSLDPSQIVDRLIERSPSLVISWLSVN